MKSMIVLALALLTPLAHADETFRFGSQMRSSLIEQDEVDAVRVSLSQWMGREAQRLAITREELYSRTQSDEKLRQRIIGEVNRVLRRLEAPVVDVTAPQLKMDLAVEVAGSKALVKGFSINDGQHRFCFPCQGLGNHFDFGVVPANARSSTVLRKIKNDFAEAVGKD